ncbi:MAG: hypothetical protein JF605_08475, partial [Burkholderia sp.]|nr:hypothetical protein [Burkholderia sp.]
VGTEGSSEYRFPGDEARRALQQAPAAMDGARMHRYSKNGRAPMPTLELYLKRIDKPTRAMRTTWNAVCLVVSGEGRSTIGERIFTWSRHDVFTIPHWTWARHEGQGDLFIVTDRALYENLDLLREEIQ